MAPGFCPHPVLTGEPSQGSRGRFWLAQRRSFAANGTRQILLGTDPHSTLKIYADHVAHLRFLPVATRVGRHPVSAT